MISKLKKWNTDHNKVLLDQGLYSGMNFLCSIVFARLIGITEFGIFSSIILVSYLAISVSSAIVIQPMQTLFGKFGKDPKYIISATYLQLIVIVLVAMTIYLVFLIAPTYLGAANNYRGDITAFICLSLLFDYFRKALLIQNDINKTLISDAILGIFQLAIVAFAFKNKMSAEGLIHFLSLAYIPILLFHLLSSNILGYSKHAFLFYVNQHAIQAKWLLPTAFIQWGASNFFVAASGLMISVEALGAFRLAQSIFGIFNIFLQSFENYVLPQAANLYATSVSKSLDYIQRISTKALVRFSVVLALIFIFSDDIITLVGGDMYISYGYVIKGMAVLYFIIIVNYPIRLSIRLLALDHLFFAGYLVSFIFSLLTAQVLLKEFQLVGALIGLGINQLIMMAIWQYHLNKKAFLIWK